MSTETTIKTLNESQMNQAKGGQETSRKKFIIMGDPVKTTPNYR